MYMIDTLFDRIDAWRHLPSYQLERRADRLFLLYMPEMLWVILERMTCRFHSISETHLAIRSMLQVSMAPGGCLSPSLSVYRTQEFCSLVSLGLSGLEGLAPRVSIRI